MVLIGLDYPYRKELRLKDFDYSRSGAYFVTICTVERKQILSSITRDRINSASDVVLTEIGLEISNTINYLNEQYGYEVF